MRTRWRWRFKIVSEKELSQSDLFLTSFSHRLEDDFELWRSKFWPAIDHLAEATEAPEELTETRPHLIYHTVQHPADAPFEAFYKARSNARETVDATHPYDALVTTTTELHTKESDRSVKHIELDISSHTSLQYQTGDYVGIYPINQPELVRAIGNRLGLDLYTMFSLCPDTPSSKRYQ